MIKYFVAYDENGTLMNIGTVNTDGNLSPAVTEITQEEYETLLASLPVPEEPAYVDPVDEALSILHGEVEA